MQHKLEKLPKSEAEVIVEIPFSEFEPHVKRAAVLISEEHEIEGFRKGKAPYEVVKQKFGDSAIYEKAADIAVRKVYPELMEDLVEENPDFKKRPPIGRPEITVTKLAPGNEFIFKIKFAFLPEVVLPNYQEIARKVHSEKKEVIVSEEEIKKTLGWLQESRSKFITVDRPAAKGDSVEINFEVRHGGVQITNGTSKNHPLEIGKGKFLPGFEDQLVGMRAGEEKSFTLAAPEDWHDKSLAGKELDFKTTMQLVQERDRPELTDDFAKGLGDFSSLASLRKNVEKGLLQEKEEKEKQRIRALMIERIAEKAEIEVPEVLIQSELGKMLEELKSGVEGMGMKWDEYLLQVKKNPEELLKEWRPEAERRVRIALVLREIGMEQNIEPSTDEIKERSDRFLEQFKTARQAGERIDPKEVEEYSRGVLRNEKVFEFLETVN